MDVDAYLAERAARIGPYLDGCVPPTDGEAAPLPEAMRHLLFPGGKRLRPAFAFAACEAVGGPTERALPIAAAVELIHTYSLVHDDLPCMDDDDERRGVPTVHKVFGEANAVLAGDALQTAAFETLARATEDATPDVRDALAGCMRDLARAAGAAGLVGGQVDDLVFADGDATAVTSIHARKTAALFEAATAGGARLGGAPADRVASLAAVGHQVGLAFQIVDDLLDHDDDDACSMLTVLGEAGARERAEGLLDDSLARLADLGEPAEPLRDLARLAVRRSL